MLTYNLKKTPGVPLYEALYRCIRADILSGELAPGEKLPSKRALAQNLEVSKITVETAYQQLLSEGFIRSREKVGYFVEPIRRAVPPKTAASSAHEAETTPMLELTAGGSEGFPFSVWSKLQREVMLDYGEKLLLPLPNQGLFSLRQAISEHLRSFRGMRVNPENILVGAGTDFLYNLLIQLLGRDKIYGAEEPGYGKIRKIYAAGGVRCVSIPMDEHGVIPAALGDAQVLHISPSHHFPTGLVTPMQRRAELLNWTKTGEKWIIEDDYDSEFRFDGHPMPTLYTMDGGHRVIYMNSFSKTLAPSIRISYMVLPGDLMEQFQSRLGFYGCTVPSFEQYTLERFLRRGHFEKHINRLRKAYKIKRNQVISAVQSCTFSDKLTIEEHSSGLHFLLRLDTPRTDRELTRLLAGAGIRAHTLSHYYAGEVPASSRRCLVINYSGLSLDAFRQALEKLAEFL